MAWQNNQSRGYDVFKWILSIVTILIIAYFVLSFFRIGLIFWLYSRIEAWVTVRLGLDYYPAQALTALAIAIVTFFMPSIAWYVLLGRKKIWGFILMAIVQVSAFGMVYTVGRDVSFDRTTGEPLKYYADTPEGRVFSFTPGFDPKFGLKFELYTREIALKSAKPVIQPSKDVCIKAKTEITQHYRPRIRRGEIVDWIPIKYNPPIPPGYYGMLVEGRDSMIYTKSGRPMYKIIWASKNDPLMVRNPENQVNRHDYILSNLIDIFNCDLLPTTLPSPSPSPEPSPSPSLEAAPTWFIPPLQARIVNVRFFESPKDMPAIGSRVYSTRFQSSSARYINWELELSFNSPGENLKAPIQIVWHGTNDEELTRQETNFDINSGTNSSRHAWGWGQQTPGYWKPGTYKLEFFDGGQKVASGAFEVY